MQCFYRFAGSGKTIEMPNGARKKIQDHKLSRYACYLIVLNGDLRKEVQELSSMVNYLSMKKDYIIAVLLKIAIIVLTKLHCMPFLKALIGFTKPFKKV